MVYEEENFEEEEVSTTKRTTELLQPSVKILYNGEDVKEVNLKVGETLNLFCETNGVNFLEWHKENTRVIGNSQNLVIESVDNESTGYYICQNTELGIRDYIHLSVSQAENPITYESSMVI